MEEGHYWFRAKRYGWGWYPARWQGWLVLFIYLFVLTNIFREIDRNAHSGSDTLIAAALPFVVLTLILIGICYLTGESPRWRWGSK